MFKNYFITAFRNLARNRTFTMLNVFGLALGISAALVLFKIVIFENSFDEFNSKYENLYRFTKTETTPNAVDIEAGLPNPFARAFEQDNPDLGQTLRTLYFGEAQLSVELNGTGWQHFQQSDGIAFVDSTFFSFFDYDWKIGNPETALSQPKSTVISVSIAEKLFGVTDGGYNRVLGKTIKVGGELDVFVTGVVSDPLLNSSIPFKMMMEYESVEGFWDFYQPESWGLTASNANVYFLKNENVSLEQIERALALMPDKYLQDNEEEVDFGIQPMSEVHFSPELGSYNSLATEKESLAIPVAVGIFLILTACINFVNLSTALAIKRAKEVGIRKVLGGVKSQLIGQFLGETFLVTLISILFSMGIAELVLTRMESLIGYNLSLDLFGDSVLMSLVLAITIMVTMLAGLYPSFVLARLKPVATLRSKGQSAVSGSINVRRGLVVGQFLISQFLVICTLIVLSQMKYFEDKDLGFRKSSIITFSLPSNEESKLSTMRNQLASYAGVEDISYNFASPISQSNIGSSFNYELAQGGADLDAAYKVVDKYYVDLYGIEVLAGRNFTENDSIDVAMVSEDVIKLMDINDPVEALGKVIGSGVMGPKKIIGVFKRFHNQNLTEGIDPMIFVQLDQFYYEGAIRYTGSDNDFNNLISHLETVWSAQYPDVLFDYNLLSETLMEEYGEQANTLTLYKVFSGVAILIGCLGLYGLVSFMANQRTKEIGVRKVLGASISQILNIFSKELFILIGIAFLIAAPLAYYFMNSWLADFEYRINIGLGVFAISIGFTLLIGFVTTMLRSYKAATINPVQSLRSE